MDIMKKIKTATATTFMDELAKVKSELKQGTSPKDVNLDGLDVTSFKQMVAGMSGSAILVTVELARTAQGHGTTKAQCKEVLKLAGCQRSDVNGHWANRKPFKGITTTVKDGMIYAYRTLTA
jgi:hypothetical protein